MKKTAASKRAALPKAENYAKAFLRDWERLSRSGRFDMNGMKQAMMLLIANEGPLGPEWLEHPLRGAWSGTRECHIGGDFLLVYRLEESGKAPLVVFAAAGTHSDLFDE